ncbi:uncharacterized protein [Embiotoca jacksoni]|uniref:uncharacterized protein isoform X2 n=1 Tax=Embiotoca jacksoni TaxID=100190 RepID=UPI003704D115
MEDHTYYLAQEKARERQSSSVKKQKRDEAKRKRERRRQKTRINIGVAFPRWKSLMTDRRFQSDAEVACFLLDSFEKLPASLTSVNGKPVHVRTLGSPGGTRRQVITLKYFSRQREYRRGGKWRRLQRTRREPGSKQSFTTEH